MKEKVAILGASSRANRFSNKAFHLLKEYGHEPIPVGLSLQSLEGTPAFASLDLIPSTVDTLTMYVGPAISAKLKNDILKLNPKRVIFNPGSENPELEMALEEAGIRVIEACTLVLLQTGQFDRA